MSCFPVQHVKLRLQHDGTRHRDKAVIRKQTLKHGNLYELLTTFCKCLLSLWGLLVSAWFTVSAIVSKLLWHTWSRRYFIHMPARGCVCARARATCVALDVTMEGEDVGTCVTMSGSRSPSEWIPPPLYSQTDIHWLLFLRCCCGTCGRCPRR